MEMKNYIKENYAIIGLWIMLFFVIWTQAVPQTVSILEATLFTICFLLSTFPSSTFLSGTLLQRAMKKRKATIFTFQFILFSAITGILFIIIMYLFSFLEKADIFPKSEYFDMNVPLSMVLVPISSGVFLNISICGVRFFEENTKLKHTLLEYQLRTLQHQVTPHFMFNVLNHINILMQEDVSLASSLLMKYSKILRYQLYSEKNEDISVELEVQFLKDYIDIEKVRWGDELRVSCSWSMEDNKKEIPSLLLITFIENAFKHVSRGISESAYVNIEFEQKANLISLKIENSKSDVQQAKDSISGLGLENIKKRLDILYPDNYHLAIENTEMIYCTQLKIKI